MNKPKAASGAQRIVVSENGPYVVYGNVPLLIQEIVPNEQGESWDWRKGEKFKTASVYELCRCGHSANKPFCDGSHQRFGFDGKETASRVPYAQQAENFDGQTLFLSDQQNLCAFARFCDPAGQIWNLIEQTDNPEARRMVIREAMHCPSGRLTVHDRQMRKEIEEPLEPAIGVVEDIALGCSGPLWVQGRIDIESADGWNYEIRNRVTLCRCGASENKPFCNGSHASIKFNDGFVRDRSGG